MMLAMQSHYKELCKEIIHLSDDIRFAGVINDNGRLVTGAVKNKITFFVDGKDRDMLFMEVALRSRMLSEFDPSLGPMSFSIYQRKNVITMEFPIDNLTIYVSAEKEFNFSEIPFKILAVLRKKKILSNAA